MLARCVLVLRSSDRRDLLEHPQERVVPCMEPAGDLTYNILEECAINVCVCARKSTGAATPTAPCCAGVVTPCVAGIGIHVANLGHQQDAVRETDSKNTQKMLGECLGQCSDLGSPPRCFGENGCDRDHKTKGTLCLYYQAHRLGTTSVQKKKLPRHMSREATCLA